MVKFSPFSGVDGIGQDDMDPGGACNPSIISNRQLVWGSSDAGLPDVGLKRTAVGILSLSDGGTNYTLLVPKQLGSKTVGVAQSSIAHGLGYIPTLVIITPTISAATGTMWKSAASDITNVYLTATAAGITAEISVR